MQTSADKLKKICTEHNHLWMGILNITPDSFSDGGLHYTKNFALKRAIDLVKFGAKIIDIGAVSTRPFAQSVSYDEELKRLLPVLKEIRNSLSSDILISVDSFNPDVVYELAQNNLIDIINDQYSGTITKEFTYNSELQKLNNPEIAAKFNLGYIIMHMKGTPENMQISPNYLNCIEEVFLFLQERMIYAERCGVKEIILDPGIGFGKTVEHNLELLSEKFIKKMSILNKSILIGLSRKWFIGQLYKELEVASQRDKVTKEFEYKCIEHGAKIIRSHVMPAELLK